MFLTIALPFALALSQRAQIPENVVITFPPVPDNVTSDSLRDVAWTKQVVEYYIVEDVKVPRGSAPVKVESREIRIRELRYPLMDSEPFAEHKDIWFFKLIPVKPVNYMPVESFGFPTQTINPGYRYLAYLRRTSVTKYERRLDPESGDALVRRTTEVSYSSYSTITNAGQSYDPRTGKIYTGKDLDIPRWPGTPKRGLPSDSGRTARSDWD